LQKNTTKKPLTPKRNEKETKQRRKTKASNR